MPHHRAQSFCAWFSLALACALCGAANVAAQSTQPVWWPPFTYYGRPVAQPTFDFPNWARYSTCRPAPLTWGYEPFPDYGPCDCNCWGYPSVNCPGDFVAHRPSAWYGISEFSALTIDHFDEFAVARVGPTGAPLLSTADLRPEFNAGGRFTIGRRICDCWRLEGTYQGVYHWSDSLLVTNSDSNLSTFLSGFSNPVDPALDQARQVTLSEQSRFSSAEINFRYWVDMPPGPMDVSFLVGARAMQLDEQFSFLGTGVTTNAVNSSTANELWGVQIGMQFAKLINTRCWCDFDMKGGMYNNQASIQASYLQNGVALPNTPVASIRDRTAWVGDLLMTFNWQMTPAITLRAGYQAIFFDGLAFAQDQVRSPLVDNVPGPFNDAGRGVVHGPILGVMGYW